MRLFRKQGEFAKLHDEEQLLHPGDIELESASSIQHGSSQSSDEGSSTSASNDNVRKNDTRSGGKRRRRKKGKQHRIGQHPAGFMSISALARETPGTPGSSTPDSNHGHRSIPPGTSGIGSDEHEDAVEEDAHEANTGLDVAEFKSDLKCKLYLLMEQPSSSNAAFWTNVIVSMLIVLSAVMTTIETIPAFRSAESNKVWFHLETAMVALFTLEYLLRVFAHSDSLRMLGRFFLSPLSIIDFIAIIPFYIELLAQRDTTYEFRFTILRLFRLLRLFKTYKYSNAIIMTIEVMVIALRRSSDALSALFFFLLTCVILLATLLYFAERGIWDESLQTFVDPDGNPSSFDSIPAAFWFVLVTITTTGYGDMVPATFIGKLVTFPAMLFGVLLIALPSIIIGRNFTIVWEAMRRRQYYSQLTMEQDDTADGPEVHDQTPMLFPTSTPPQANGTSPGTAPPPRNYDILGGGDDAIIEQLQALMAVTRQNQEAIQHILSILEKQGKAIPNEHQHEVDIAQRRGSLHFRKRPSQQHGESSEDKGKSTAIPHQDEEDNA
ncbi:voltage-gated potassium channel [Lichtheimia hyalospora FSU 10163]|nr:voltage-gated potassium channel [Lichtheimia hyalospora FSU 10163]